MAALASLAGKKSKLNIRHQNNWRDRALIFLPYMWMLLFFLVPFLIIFKISFSVTEIAIPPYSPIITFED